MKKNILLTLIGVLIFATIAFAAQSILMEMDSLNELALVVVEPQLIDFGDIDQGGGIVTTTTTVKNVGNEPLEINRLSTSCGCTAAEMDTSPIQPNEERTMTITFDPMAHPDQSGPITRVVYLQTSDESRPEIEIDVIGNVIPVN